LSYRGFLAREGPVALLGLVCVFAVVWFTYRREMPSSIPPEPAKNRISVHYPIMLKSIAVVGVMLIAFLAGVPIALVAIAGAAYPLFRRRVSLEKFYGEVNGQLLVLLVGLFAPPGPIEGPGLVDDLAHVRGRVGLHRPAVLTIKTAVLSNIVSNVPAVLLL